MEMKKDLAKICPILEAIMRHKENFKAKGIFLFQILKINYNNEKEIKKINNIQKLCKIMLRLRKVS